MRTNHNRITSLGLLVVLFYLPVTLGVQFKEMMNGSSSPLLNMGFAYLGLEALWQHRHQLTNGDTTEEDRLLGYLMIFGGAIAFALCSSSLSLQALTCMIILAGIVISNWGLKFVGQNFVPASLLLLSLYPDLLFLGNSFRKVLTDSQLEYFMAWISGTLLKLAGQPITIQGSVLSLSTTLDAKKAVEVASGCSGFDMAFILAGVGLCFGLFFKLNWQRTLSLIAVGVILALLFNIPRVILLAYAVVYWGPKSFDFWHGPIGGQIFATILLTIYYYAAMAIADQSPKATR